MKTGELFKQSYAHFSVRRETGRQEKVPNKRSQVNKIPQIQRVSRIEAPSSETGNSLLVEPKGRKYMTSKMQAAYH